MEGSKDRTAAYHGDKAVHVTWMVALPLPAPGAEALTRRGTPKHPL